MKYLNNFNESKKPLKLIYKGSHMENDHYIKEVYCAETIEGDIIKGRKYRLYAEFETGNMLSGKCYVVFTENKVFKGFDSDYFLEEYQWYATQKYNM